MLRFSFLVDGSVKHEIDRLIFIITFEAMIDLGAKD